MTRFCNSLPHTLYWPKRREQTQDPMTNSLTKAWRDFIRPIWQRPPRLQVAALCYATHEGGKQVLLITSRGTGRWIIPKGWPMKNKNAAGAAMQEAWEEAGVRKGRVGDKPLGSYSYEKELKTGLTVPVETLVFPVEVTDLKDDFPESHQRQRKWVAPAEAANMVAEPELQEILRDL